MRICVIGTGMQGTACLQDLARRRAVAKLAAADRETAALEKLRGRDWAAGIATRLLDISASGDAARLLADYDVAVSAVPYFYNEGLTRAAIEAGCHLVDMGGNTEVVRAQHALAGEARLAGVSILPDAGLAPGLVAVLAGHLIREESPDEVLLRVGGLPQSPRPPLGYRISFSPYGLLNEYAGGAILLRNGEVGSAPALEEEEQIAFDAMPALEAALTSGGVSTLPYTFEGRVSELNYKTIRYRGHFAQLRLLRDLGLLDDRTLSLPAGSGGEAEISLRDLMARLLEEKIGGEPEPDRILLRVMSRAGGRAGGPARVRLFEAHDLYDRDTGLSAMQRCTAYPVAVEALMLGEGRLPPGVLKQETDIDAARMADELRKRGIDLRERLVDE
jgi:lysine 6-dehydrogenase